MGNPIERLTEPTEQDACREKERMDILSLSATVAEALLGAHVVPNGADNCVPWNGGAGPMCRGTRAAIVGSSVEIAIANRPHPFVAPSGVLGVAPIRSVPSTMGTVPHKSTQDGPL